MRITCVAVSGIALAAGWVLRRLEDVGTRPSRARVVATSAPAQTGS